LQGLGDWEEILKNGNKQISILSSRGARRKCWELQVGLSHLILCEDEDENPPGNHFQARKQLGLVSMDLRRGNNV